MPFSCYTKHYIWVLCLVIGGYTSAQDFSASTYPMQSTTQTLYPPILADTLFYSGKDSGSTPLIPIGFNFHYCTLVYDSFSVNTDGFVRLGKAAVPVPFNSLDSTTNNPLIGPYWKDMTTGTNGHVITWVTDTFPNRKRIIQWKTTVPKNLTAPAGAIFQLVLFERTGIIRFIYNNTPANFGHYTCGFTNYMHGKHQTAEVRTLSTGGTAFFNLTNHYTNTIALTARAYTFYPDSTKPAMPLGLNLYPGADCAVLAWNDASFEEVAFNVFRSTDSIHFQHISTVHSETVNAKGRRYFFHDYNLVNGTKYYYRLTANSMGGYPSDTVRVSFTATTAPLSGIKNIPGDYVTITEAFEHINCAQLAGPLVLELHNGYDTLQEIFPIELTGNYNTSAINTVTLRPAPGISTPFAISAYPATRRAFNIKKYFVCKYRRPSRRNGQHQHA